ncbi:hypothetical protein NDU88_001237 [Pleurodeles waltl]|uniref:Uncharacterized protein n=1 Tax=Pleurodeles waltl TaxID=8319 RepID=A0AAV7MJ58_PLEWA|nr:hypothetical protein NDU88_001237 [Pleurodeles waltl]
MLKCFLVLTPKAQECSSVREWYCTSASFTYQGAVELGTSLEHGLLLGYDKSAMFTTSRRSDVSGLGVLRRSVTRLESRQVTRGLLFHPHSKGLARPGMGEVIQGSEAMYSPHKPERRS